MITDQPDARLLVTTGMETVVRIAKAPIGFSVGASVGDHTPHGVDRKGEHDPGPPSRCQGVRKMTQLDGQLGYNLVVGQVVEQLRS